MKEIAELLGRDRSIVYREIKRARVSLLDYELVRKQQYKANAGQ